MSAVPEEHAQNLNPLGVIVRLTALGGKFLLVLYLAKYVSLDALGIYGVFTATTAIGSYIVGFEFGQHATRELVIRAAEDRAEIVWSQARFIAVGHLAAAPFFVGIYAVGLLPWWTFVWFFPILITTHLCQEIQRVLIAVSRPVAAHVILAAAHGAWVFPVVAWGVLDPSRQSLEVVFVFWTMVATASALGGAIYLRRLGLMSGGPSRGSWRIVQHGLAASRLLFASSICYRIMEVADRYFIQWLMGERAVGVYTFYGRVLGAMNDIIYVGVVSVLFPRIVASYAQKDMTAYAAASRKLLHSLVIATAVLVPAFGAGIYALLWFVDDSSVRDHLAVYFILLLGVAILNISLSPHYALYARRLDRVVLIATAGAAVLTVALNALLVPHHGLIGAACATVGGVTALALAKKVLDSRYKDEDAVA